MTQTLIALAYLGSFLPIDGILLLSVNVLWDGTELRVTSVPRGSTARAARHVPAAAGRELAMTAGWETASASATLAGRERAAMSVPRGTMALPASRAPTAVGMALATTEGQAPAPAPATRAGRERTASWKAAPSTANAPMATASPCSASTALEKSAIRIA